MVTRPRRGEVWWARTGDKVRPVMIVSSDALNRRPPKVLVAPGTTNLRAWPDEVTVDTGFLPRPTAFCCRELTPVPVATLETLAGAVGRDTLELLCATMAAVLGCRPAPAG